MTLRWRQSLDRARRLTGRLIETWKSSSPAAASADFSLLRTEEAFKRRRERLKLEVVCGLLQQDLIIDVVAKISADNITSLGRSIRQAQRRDQATQLRSAGSLTR
jgi:hypothetical protein